MGRGGHLHKNTHLEVSLYYILNYSRMSTHKQERTNSFPSLLDLSTSRKCKMEEILVDILTSTFYNRSRQPFRTECKTFIMWACKDVTVTVKRKDVCAWGGHVEGQTY